LDKKGKRRVSSISSDEIHYQAAKKRVAAPQTIVHGMPDASKWRVASS